MISSMLLPLKETMHSISQGLLMPVIAILLLFIAAAIIEAGGILAEAVLERRRAKVNVPDLINQFQGKDASALLEVVETSQLYKRQKKALSEMIEQSDLPTASLMALSRRLLTAEELHYVKVTNRTDLIARLGPMFGLMATLIPLGPGLIALGQGDTKTLAESLLTAFDATVAGLGAAGVAFAISKLRKRWYEDYLSSLEALMESLLEVFAHDRGAEK